MLNVVLSWKTRTYTLGKQGVSQRAPQIYYLLPRLCLHKLVKQFESPWNFRFPWRYVYDWATDDTVGLVVIATHRSVVSMSLPCRLQRGGSHLKHMVELHRKLIALPSYVKRHSGWKPRKEYAKRNSKNEAHYALANLCKITEPKTNYKLWFCDKVPFKTWITIPWYTVTAYCRN